MSNANGNGNGKLWKIIGIPGGILALVVLVFTLTGAKTAPIERELLRHERMIEQGGESTSQYLRDIQRDIREIKDTVLVWSTRGSIR